MTPPRSVLEPADAAIVPRHPEHNLTVQPGVRNQW
jgi:hypothetical protein